jgi:hypothetical protein
VWWFTPAILALQKVRQDDLEFKARLGDMVSSKTLSHKHIRPCLKKERERKNISRVVTRMSIETKFYFVTIYLSFFFVFL